MTPALRVAVRAVIVRDGMVALAAFDDESGYHYNLPGGGLEPGEGLYEGLRREVREELGCEVEIGPLLLAYENRPAPALQVPPYAIHGLGLFFLCALPWGQEPRLPPTADEHQIDVCWVPLGELERAPLMPQVGAHIRRALAERAVIGQAQDPFVVEDVDTFPPRLPNWSPLPPFVVSTEAQQGRPSATTFNCRQLSLTLWTGGMPNAGQLQALRRVGCSAVINLATAGGEPCLADEADICSRLGLRYQHLPVNYERPTVGDYAIFEQRLAALAGARVLVHCRKNYRASVFAYLWRVRHGEPEPVARADMLAVWRPDAAWSALIEAVLSQ
ncbi:MAG: NUDIX domain-containing protein [Anaerolineae bacterium]